MNLSPLVIAPQSDRDAKGRLLPGHSAGGRPKGSPNVAGRAEIDRLRQRSAAVWQVIDQRLAMGCFKTALWLAGRLLPDSRIVELDSDDPAALAQAVVDGTLSPVEAGRVANAIKNLRDVAELGELRDKLTEIEALLAPGRR